MATCKLKKTKLILYLFDELSASEKDNIADHINSCQSCQRELKQLNTSVSFYNSLQGIDPPAIRLVTNKGRKNLVRHRMTRKKARKLIPAFGFVSLVIIITISYFCLFKTDKNSRYWSLENSWEGPYRYHFERIDSTIETIKNDTFFN
jgi:hypothetical protein